MNENLNEKKINPVNLLIDAFWAVMPEKTAEEIAGFKKNILLTVRDGLNFIVSKEIEWTDKHLENARKMRERYHGSETQSPPDPTRTDA